MIEDYRLAASLTVVVMVVVVVVGGVVLEAAVVMLVLLRCRERRWRLHHLAKVATAVITVLMVLEVRMVVGMKLRLLLLGLL